MKNRHYLVLAVLLPLFAARFVSFLVAFYFNARFFLVFVATGMLTTTSGAKPAANTRTPRNPQANAVLK